MEILYIENLSFRYPGSDAPALQDINLSLEAGSFNLLTGGTGSGKSTLLKAIKPETAPYGRKSGRVKFFDSVTGLEKTPKASDAGFVAQDPDAQIVTDKVWHELAFGLENAGLPQKEILARIGEAAAYFGLEDKFEKPTDSLSGGEKQLLCLASAAAARPELLLLDEPTSCLDPISAESFLDILKRLNRELGITVLLSEHRLEALFGEADRVIALSEGKITAYGPPEAVCRSLKDSELFEGFPTAARIWKGVNARGAAPLTVSGGRELVRKTLNGRRIDAPAKIRPQLTETAVKASGIWFRYEKDGRDILKGADIELKKGESLVMLGGNGSGKSTTLRALAGIAPPYRGKTEIFGVNIKKSKKRAALLPQEPADLFIRDTVWEDMLFAALLGGVKKEEAENKARAAAEKHGISPLLKKNPADLSGGELQKCALAKLLLTEPEIIMLDEPTKGLDAKSKRALCSLIKELTAAGKSVLTVTHDIEFAAEAADRCALLFNGSVLTQAPPEEFFSGNIFYKTAAARICEGFIGGVTTCGDAVNALNGVKNEA